MSSEAEQWADDLTKDMEPDKALAAIFNLLRGVQWAVEQADIISQEMQIAEFPATNEHIRGAIMLKNKLKLLVREK